MSGIDTAFRIANNLRSNFAKVLLGKDFTVPLTAILGGGHILCTDVPGVGKTVFSKIIARSFGCTYSRLQCTADLLPSDIIGVNIYDQKRGEFEFKRGPIFSQILLADEISRATPKAQSALLECMEEHQVTVNGQTYPMNAPFLVIATQNPIEHEGTFPLPEAQLDRFMISLDIGYPDPQSECNMLTQQRLEHPLDSIAQIASAEELAQAQAEVRSVTVSSSITEYIVALVSFTRTSAHLSLGASPRGSQSLYRAAQALAAIQNRKYVIPDDVQMLAAAALQHRVIPKRRFDRALARQAIEEALSTIPVPTA
ncbi:MoxR family ATPase [bacterium]|nr:MoxR family ATPase [bacterium]